MAALEPGAEVVVFVMGMRINRLWMFWKSFEALEEYARASGNMPSFGLGSAFGIRTMTSGVQSAAARLGLRADGTLPVEPY